MTDTIISIQAQGKYVMAPGSRHPSGCRYRIVSATDKIATINAPQFTAELLARLKEVAPKLGYSLEKNPESTAPKFAYKGTSPLVKLARKKGVTVLDILKHYEIPVRGKMARCPFHDDRVPSFSFNEELWNCFGCGAKGNIVGLVRKLESKQHG